MVHTQPSVEYLRRPKMGAERTRSRGLVHLVSEETSGRFCAVAAAVAVIVIVIVVAMMRLDRPFPSSAGSDAERQVA